MAWLRLPPKVRDGKVVVLPTVEHHCSVASVNRKLAALTSFCGFHARHGVELAGLLVTMQPANRRGGAATAYKPFLHHVTKTKPEQRRAITLKTVRIGRKYLRRNRFRQFWMRAIMCGIDCCLPCCSTPGCSPGVSPRAPAWFSEFVQLRS